MESDERRSDRAREAQGYADELAARLPDAAGVALGGSLSRGHSTFDRFSDIDLFCYLSAPVLPGTDLLADLLALSERELRRRAYLIEFRRFLGPFDANIKFFLVDHMNSYADRVPSLDDQYLEEMDSYQYFEVLFDPSGAFAQLLHKARAKKAADVGSLAELAVERYGKSIGWSVMQGVHRNDWVTATISMTRAVDALLCLLFLMAEEYPPSLKWRASRRMVTTVENGEAFYAALASWTKLPRPFDPAEGLRALHAMERVVAGEYTMPPWNRHQERWWWGSYQPA